MKKSSSSASQRRKLLNRLEQPFHFFLTADVGCHDVDVGCVQLGMAEQVSYDIGTRVAAGQDEVLRAFGDQPSGNAVAKHSEAAGDEIGGMRVDRRWPRRQFREGLLDQP
jgi:hypothetical protein